VEDGRIYVDHGLTGTNRDRPGLREAMAAGRAGDTLVVTKLDRLARSIPDARDIATEFTQRGISLNLGGSRYDPTDPVGRLLFNILAMVAEFEADLIRMRTREGMAVARAKGRLRGKQPKLSPASNDTCSRCTPPANTPKPNWPSSSMFRAPRSTAPYNAPTTKTSRELAV
jgi:DNA invertase Pin-like site-specific DNA recombinase